MKIPRGSERVKQSLISIVNFKRRIASKPGPPEGQPFAAHRLLSCEQRSSSYHVGCMHLPNCHPRHRAFALPSSATLAPFLGGAQFNGCIREEKLYNRGFTLKSTNLQTALLPLLPWLLNFCSPISCQKPFFRCYLGWRRPARTQRSVRESVAQLRRRPIRSTEFRMRLSLAWPLRSTQPQVTSHDIAALAPRRRLRSRKPKAQRWTWSCRHSSSRTKKIGGVLHIPASGDDVTFQRLAAVSSSSLGHPCKGSYHTAAKLSQPHLHVLLVSSNGRMSWGR